jgi:hypothetical protein
MDLKGLNWLCLILCLPLLIGLLIVSVKLVITVDDCLENDTLIVESTSEELDYNEMD